VFYIHHKDFFHNALYIKEDLGLMSFDQAKYLRQKYGFNINFGGFINIRKRIGLNLYSGIGIRIRDNLFSEVVNPAQIEEFRDMFYFDAYREIEGLKTGPNISAGLKLILK